MDINIDTIDILSLYQYKHIFPQFFHVGLGSKLTIEILEQGVKSVQS